MIDEEEDKFIKENPIIFKKYKVKRKLGEGAFGEVYLGQAIEDNAYVALKVEPRKIAKPILESEAFLLYSIAGVGIPEVKSFGKVKNFTVLVEPLLGKSLFDIFAENHKVMSMEDVCLIGKQVIDRIQWVHSKFIVHRDIKPDNFLIGKKDPNVIYIIDFGLSKKYRSSATNKHIRFGFTGKLTGTVRFASANALRGGEQSRRDDIESIGYMLVYFLKKRLPWQGITGTRKMERYLKIYKMKKNTSPQELCSGLPPEMTEYITYAKKLEFEQQPDYKYLRGLFGKMLKRIHNTNDQLIFSWIKLTDLPNLKNPVNPATRKDSPQSRIYKKIKSSLERERNLSSDSADSNPGSYQQVFTQGNALNLKVIDKNNYADSEMDQKTDKKINKKILKAKEGLNTVIANLDVTVDETYVDFENERLKRGSKDIGEFTINSNNTEKLKTNFQKTDVNNPNNGSNTIDLINNNIINGNNKINSSNNKKINFDTNNILNNNYPINNNHELNLNNNNKNLFNNNLEINQINSNNNSIKNKSIANNQLSKDENNNIINNNIYSDKNYPLNNINNPSSNNSNPINSIINNPSDSNSNPININMNNPSGNNSNLINNNMINPSNNNLNPINNNMINPYENKFNPINNNLNNPSENKFNPINNNLNNPYENKFNPINSNFNNPFDNKTNPMNINNNINPTNSVTNSNLKVSTEGNKPLLKTSNIDGKEFTFSEPLDSKSKFVFAKKLSKEIIKENEEEKKEENSSGNKVLTEEEKNNIAALLTIS